MDPQAAEPARSAGSGGPSTIIRLPHAPAAVGVARRRIRHELADTGIGAPLLDDIEVVASELLGNAVLHAQPIGGGLLLAGWRLKDGVLTVRVTDGGSLHRVHPVDDAPLAESGRGLHIIDRLAQAWGVIDHAGGVRTVWASFATGARKRGLQLVR